MYPRADQFVPVLSPLLKG